MGTLAADNLDFVQRWVGNSRQWLIDFLAEAPRLPQVVAVIAMGSAVRDRSHRRSDFDALVIYASVRPSLKAPMEVDIRFTDTEHLDELVAEGNEIVCWALMFGVPVFDPLNRWRRLQAEWSGRIPLPLASEARSRAMATLARAREMLEADDESAADDLLLAALTQLARERLIKSGIYPASRPELPDQLRTTNHGDRLARLLEMAMFGNSAPGDLLKALDELAV